MVIIYWSSDVFFFFKTKTAYEMRISDWSSDVCSSDLPTDPQIAFHLARFIEHVRSIPADPVVLRKNWLSAYEFVTSAGGQALNDHARNNDPFEEVGKFQEIGRATCRERVCQ